MVKEGLPSFTASKIAKSEPSYVKVASPAIALAPVTVTIVLFVEPVKAGKADTPSKRFNSVAEEVTNEPPNFKPPAAPSCVEMSTVMLPSVARPTISIPFVRVPSFSAT